MSMDASYAHERPTLAPTRWADRRAARRLPLELDVAVEGAAQRFTATSADLSSGGLFLATPRLIPVGTQVMLSFTLPNGVDLEILGTVQWRKRDGLGIAFFCLDLEIKDMLIRFCAVREPIYFADDTEPDTQHEG
jgi:hypothetical protein